MLLEMILCGKALSYLSVRQYFRETQKGGGAFVDRVVGSNGKLTAMQTTRQPSQAVLTFLKYMISLIQAFFLGKGEYI